MELEPAEVKINSWSVKMFWAVQASFFNPIKPHKVLPNKFWNILEWLTRILNYTMMKYEKLFYSLHMALTPAAVKINRA